MYLAALLCWFLPESPVYLLSLNRIEEAIQVMQKIARWNRKENNFR